MNALQVGEHVSSSSLHNEEAIPAGHERRLRV
jgi:hypothetical protein